MRLTLWQQFSSNHSSNFTVVGQFASPKQAESAAAEIKHILETIGAWWEQYSDDREQDAVERNLRQNKALSPPELMFREQYGIGWTQYSQEKWEYPLDWVLGRWASEAVMVYRDLVFITPSNNTWAGEKPFDLILQKLGAVIAVDCEDKCDVRLKVEGVAQDEAEAERISTLIRVYPERSIVVVPSFGMTAGKFERDGRRLRFSDIHLVFANIGHNIEDNFAKLIMFLEAQGVTDVQYHFTDVPVER